jgi:hypothetical protein
MTQNSYETQSYPQDAFPRFAAAVSQAPDAQAQVSQPMKWASIILSLVALAFLPPVFGAAAALVALRIRKVHKATGDGLLRLAGVCTGAGMIIGGAIALAAA